MDRKENFHIGYYTSFGRQKGGFYLKKKKIPLSLFS